ncbi:MAG: SDR family NAD(P)-dependent oxidoreductase, partial [Propionibacteriaceae bacterium]|nr:SDR family NAD(P)-dependent oxidoreductase [Propionibacteriaceae bacterium]
DEEVAKLADAVGGELDVLVNNAGGAFGLEPVAQADLGNWLKMYELNVLGTAKVTKALLPALVRARGAAVFVTSTAADWGYEGGAGYCGAKAAERSLVESLRLEFFDQPVRIMEICPGMVHTEEFSLVRLGDQAKADAIYKGVAEPLRAEDVARAITFMATGPAHVNIDRMTIRPVAQAAQYKVFRQ